MCLAGSNNRLLSSTALKNADASGIYIAIVVVIDYDNDCESDCDLQFGHGGDDLPAEGLQWRDLMHVGHVEDGVADAEPG
mgnify:CR=1 FL=1